IKTTGGIKKGDKVLDLGCGNAVLYDHLAKKSIDYVGVDLSSHLLNLAKKRIKAQGYNKKVHLVKGNIIALPLKDNQFDWVLALAVLHHIPSKELQFKSAQEIYRVLKSKGQAVISVWNLYSSYAEKKFKIQEQLKIIPTGWSEKDLLTPWRATPKKVIQRYLYRFDKKELKKILQLAGFKKVKIYYGDSDGNSVADLQKSYNIIALVQKL
ncbi:MAG: class I SAM-dependent methyltransferase, partial [Candidatus Magasanikbacteria bacterium]|nr:class I SAM-dependent methyltransferase [Candidatus Magasanikbacteria bacterium]